MSDPISDKLQEAHDNEPKVDPNQRKIAALQSEKRALEQHVAQLEDDLELAHLRFDTLAGIKEPLPVYSFDPPKRRSKKARPRVIAGCLASDWHVGEQVTLGQTNGLNEYDPELAKLRSENFFDRVLWRINVERSGAEIDTLVCSLLGDMMTGFIHEDLRQTNYMSPTEEVRFFKQLLKAGLDYWLENGDFRRIVIPCQWGNHGRINYDRPLIHAAMRNSYEAMAYWDLQDAYADESRVEFVVSQGSHVYVNIEGYMIRNTHGNGFRYSGGIGGLTIPLVKYLMRLDKGIQANLTLFGHWHQYLDILFAIGNGSNKGIDAFSMEKGFDPEPAQQAMYTFDPISKRRLSAAPVFVESPDQWQKRKQEAMTYEPAS